MKLAFYTVSAVTLSVLVSGCGMSSRSDRSALKESEMDNRPVATKSMHTTDKRAAVTEFGTSQSPEDVALASTVKRRISEDLTINTKGMSVSADQGKIYLHGTADSRDEKMRAEQHALEVAGVSSVDNRLQAQSAAVARDSRTARTGDSGSCTLAAVIPATRTESSFGAVEMRVFDDVNSPLYRGSRDKTYEGRERDRDRVYEERSRGAESRQPDLSEITPRVAVPSNESTPSGAGPTGGTMQAEAAQQGGTLEQTGRSSDATDERRAEAYNDRERARIHGDRNIDDSRVRRDDERIVASNERARAHGEEARLSDRRDNLIWAGWLKNGERRDISSERGPIRYDYRFAADERFHDNKGAWCNDGQRVIVP